MPCNTYKPDNGETISSSIDTEYREESISIWSKIKIISGFLSVIVGIVILYMAHTGKLETIAGDIFGSVSKDANPYIEIVQDVAPFDNGRTYKSAYNQSFDSNKWTYFKSDGERIVQVTSKCNEFDAKIITQFSVTPTDENNGEYWIEPYAMRINDYQLSTSEMELVIFGIFSDEIMQILAEFFGY